MTVFTKIPMKKAKAVIEQAHVLTKQNAKLFRENLWSLLPEDAQAANADKNNDFRYDDGIIVPCMVFIEHYTTA